MNRVEAVAEPVVKESASKETKHRNEPSAADVGGDPATVHGSAVAGARTPSPHL